MRDKALATIRRYTMLAPGDNVLAGVSGGADSVALLHFLCACSQELSITVRVAHVNHGLRGAESDADEASVAALCAELGVKLDTLRLDGLTAKAKAAGRGLEDCAREERYRWFEELAAENGAKIATAHTLDDSAETTLFHLARGTGLRGLRGIPPVRGRIIRPLIACTRTEIEDYCKANGLSWVTDSTNLSDDYARNRIRHHVVPQLRQAHGGFDAAYARMTGYLAQDEDFLAGEAARALAGAARGEALDTAALATLHPALRYRVLSHWLGGHGLPCDSVKAELLLARLGGAHFALELTRGSYAEIEGGLLRIRRETAPTPYFELPVKPGSFAVNHTMRVVFRLTNYEQYKHLEKYDTKVLKNAVSYDRIYGDLVFRQKRDGDKICLAQTGMTKPLKKLFQEAKLTAWQRQNTPVLADETGVLWAFGFGADKRAAVREGAGTILIVSIAEELGEDDEG